MMIMTTMTTEKEPVESELKWEICAEAWVKLSAALPLVRNLEQDNKFFDSSEFDMRGDRWALRLRTENEKTFLTAKGPAQYEGNLTQRPEIEVLLSEQEAQAFVKKPSLNYDHAPCEYLKQVYGDLNLQEVLSFSNLRKVVLWEGFELELDHSRAFGEDRYEIEWEGELVTLRNKKQALEAFLDAKGIEFRASSQGKLAWALEVSLKAG